MHDRFVLVQTFAGIYYVVTQSIYWNKYQMLLFLAPLFS